MMRGVRTAHGIIYKGHSSIRKKLHIDPITLGPKVSRKPGEILLLPPPKFCDVIFVVQEFFFQKKYNFWKIVCSGWRGGFSWQ